MRWARRGQLLVQALARELAQSEQRVRRQVETRLELELARQERDGALAIPFAELDEREFDKVRIVVRGWPSGFAARPACVLATPEEGGSIRAKP